MATPYVVPKIPLTKTSGEFEHCNNVDPSKLSSCTASVANITSGACRFAASPWCAVCERESQDFNRHNKETRSTKREPSLCTNDNRLSLESSLQESSKILKTVTHSSLKAHIVHDHFDHKLSTLTHKSNIFLSPSKNTKTSDVSHTMLTSEFTGVHDKYVREVEVLKGKIQELRENLQKQFAEPQDITVNVPKIVWNEKPYSCHPSEYVPSNEIKNEQYFNSTDFKRTRKSSDSEKVEFVSNAVGPKRLRDASPELKKDLFTSKYDGAIGLPNNHKTTLDVIFEKATENCIIPAKTRRILKKSEELQTPDVSKEAVVHPSLRPSLFPGVPPYIKFVNHESKAEKQLPLPIIKVLRWKITTITPVVVRKTVINSGYKLVRQSPDWTGTWGKHMRSVMFRTIRENQKINHFPGTFQIGRKDKLWKNLYHLMTVFSKREFGFIPRTYVLPQDMKLLRIAWEKGGGSECTWIIKPPASARGTGIKVVNKWAQIPKKTPLIVQKYISNPYLINGNKFDLRLYALVTSFNPLRIYLYDNGLVRFASVKYSEDVSCLSDRYMHLTNYSINKFSNNYHHNEDADACQGHKWTIKTLWSYFEGEGIVDVNALWASLVDLVIKTVMCGEKSICSLTKSNLTSQYCSYELFGVDVLLDENLRPWLLEVNISPSLHSASPLDLAVKGPMIQDILNMAGYHIPDLLPEQHKTDLHAKVGLDSSQPLVYDKNLYIAGLSPNEKEKQEKFQEMDRPDYLESILQNITPDDARQLIHYEDELTQIGSFEKIFPTTKTHSYLKYFSSPQYYNKLFDAWESKYSSNRSEGINLLKSLCQKGHHLNIEEVSLHISLSSSEILMGEQERSSSVTTTSSDLLTPISSRHTDNEPLQTKGLNKKRKKAGKMKFVTRPYRRMKNVRGWRVKPS